MPYRPKCFTFCLECTKKDNSNVSLILDVYCKWKKNENEKLWFSL